MCVLTQQWEGWSEGGGWGSIIYLRVGGEGGGGGFKGTKGFKVKQGSCVYMKAFRSEGRYRAGEGGVTGDEVITDAEPPPNPENRGEMLNNDCMTQAGGLSEHLGEQR